MREAGLEVNEVVKIHVNPVVVPIDQHFERGIISNTGKINSCYLPAYNWHTLHHTDIAIAIKRLLPTEPKSPPRGGY